MTMNYELKHMKALQEQKDKILLLDPKQQALGTFGARVCGYTKDGCRRVLCDAWSMFLLIAALFSFIFFVVCHLLNEKQSEPTTALL